MIPIKDLKEITDLVKRDIKGRIGNVVDEQETNNVEVVMEYVLRAGGGRGGNHLEIGTLFGGSAIAVALAKKKYNQPGMVVCVDPLDGYYQDRFPDPSMVDEISNIPVTPTTLFHNITKFGVGDRILVLRSKSEAIANLVDMQFTTANIDGDHWDDEPLKDWNRVKDIVSRYVIFDNYDADHPAIVNTCNVADQDPDWRWAFQDDISVVLERIMPMPLATLDVLERVGCLTT
jgi:hypothetical protein